MDAKTACAALGLKPQTLYAYVSRGKIRTTQDPEDARSSLYARRDVDTLLGQKRRPRARADIAQAAIRWGDPVLETSISEVRDGTFWIRGHRIEDCARTMTLEEVATLLCGTDTLHCAVWGPPPPGTDPFARAIRALALETETSKPIDTRDSTHMAHEAGRMLSLVTNACLGGAYDGPLHRRVAQAWGCAPQVQDHVRHALVLMCDHELNPSTFAVRVCASTGASLPASLIAGLATLSGARHGGAADLTAQALAAQGRDQFTHFMADQGGTDPYAYGFGHPLYPDGDPRAASLLGLIPEGAPVKQAVTTLGTRLGLAPNVDAGLVAFTTHFGCPVGAARTLFGIGRMAGWIAHAIEQAQSGSIIRPRAKFRDTSAQK